MSYIGNEPIVSATRTITEITATAGQTVFVANGGYTVGYIDVFVNGAQLQTSDFTASNGSSITLITGASIGDDIRLVAWGTFQTANAQPLSTELTAIAAAGNTMFKNRIINGAMVIDQRNAGASVTPANGAYTLDRWYVAQTAGASKFSVQQNAGSVTRPAGFTNYLGATSLSAYTVGATDQYALRQMIEGFNVADLSYGTASASPITLSFWVRSSLTGSFGGSLYNPNADRSYVFSYTISAANTWEYKTISFVGDTASALTTNNGAGLLINLSIGYGSTYSTSVTGGWVSGFFGSATGATSVVGTNGATFYITGVQLEKGSTATSFDYRPYGTELALCQRYYWRMVSSSGQRALGVWSYLLGTYAEGFVQFPVAMRANPSLDSNTVTNGYAVYRNGGENVFNSVVLGSVNNQTAFLYSSGGGTSGTAGNAGSAYLATALGGYVGFSAEL